MNIAIIVAGGKGKRMRKRINKLFLLLNKEPIILRTLRTFQEAQQIKKIILVVHPDDKAKFSALVKAGKLAKVKSLVDGGQERQDSVYNGLQAIKKASNEDIVVVHNAANPFVDQDLIGEIIQAAKKYGAAAAGFPAKDTIKAVENGFVRQTIDRTQVWQAQTPQAMKYFLAKKAFEIAKREGFYGTDDISLVEKMGGQVKMVFCDRSNIKITDQHDLAYANTLSAASRIGIGMDSHQFVEGKDLIIGGIRITGEFGFNANSDGDVVLHALFNALSTAIGGKSLGFYADKLCKEGVTDSKKYLNIMLEKMGGKRLKVQNIAVMLEGKKPKIDGHIPALKKSLAKLLSVKEDRVGIAATSGEDLTGFGKGEGMGCVVGVVLRSR